MQVQATVRDPFPHQTGKRFTVETTLSVCETSVWGNDESQLLLAVTAAQPFPGDF